MITVNFLTSEDVLLGFRIDGHASYGNGSTDIVCAAVSSAAYMAVNTITDIQGIQAKPEVKDGSMGLLIPKSGANQAKLVLDGLVLHLTELSKQYPANIEIIYTEVTNA